MNMNNTFRCFGNPKPHSRPLKEHFSKNGHTLLQQNQFLKIFVNILSMSGQHLPILVNIRYCVRTKNKDT